MKRNIIVFLFCFLSISAFPSDYNNDFREAICKVLSVPEMNKGIKNWDKLAIYTREPRLVGADTILNGLQLQFYGDVEAIFFDGHKYWLEVSGVTFSRKRIKMRVFYNHFGNRLSNYFPYGRFILKKEKKGWMLTKHRIKYLKYYQIEEMVERESYHVSEKVR